MMSVMLWPFVGSCCRFVTLTNIAISIEQLTVFVFETSTQETEIIC